MVTIETSKRLLKRIMLANLVSTKKDLFLTPLICGPHGIGKSQIVKKIADEINGYCITIEGGVLKEGEITGIPYQTKDENGNTVFRFLSYYAIERIQKKEKEIFEKYNNSRVEKSILEGDENYFSRNDLSPTERIQLIRNQEIEPVIIFIDEINRTENTVYKELMNILLTRTVNGYVLPWWVFFVGAMNPSTLGSVYATNEMDPAQLDRFIKINVKEDYKEWIKYAENSNIDKSIIDFISFHPKCLSSREKFEDEELSTPTPRGWDMIDTIIKSVPLLKCFFNENENKENVERIDLRHILTAKLGSATALMFFENQKNTENPISISEILDDDSNLTGIKKRIKKLNQAKILQSINLMINYFENNAQAFIETGDFIDNKIKVKEFVKLLDSSNKLLLAQKMIDIEYDGENLLIKLFDVFEEELLEVLDLSEEARKIISRSMNGS